MCYNISKLLGGVLLKKLLIFFLVALMLSGCALTGGDGTQASDTPTTAPNATTDSPNDTADTSNDALTDTTASDTENASAPEVNPEEYFSDSVFIGDSIMEGIRQYVEKSRQNADMLGDAKFITSTAGISLADLTGKREPPILYRYKGKDTPLSDILAELSPKRVFLLLGLNDMSAANSSVPETILLYKEFIHTLKSRGLEVIVITNPPKIASSWLPDYVANRNFNNELILSFVTELRLMCEAENIPYVDAYEHLAVDGALPTDFCRDGYLHLNNSGAAVVVEALYNFVSTLSQ